MTAARDDRVLRSSRVLGAFIVPFLLVAFVALYFFPHDTRSYFAWEIDPSMTPMLMGAGYVAGTYFFAMVVRARAWHRVHVGFLPITAFTIFLCVSTFANLDVFIKQNAAFWLWTGLYVTTPILVPLAWLANRRTDPGTVADDDVMAPTAVRAALLSVGAIQVLVALVLLLSPQTMIDLWPWALQPLAAQVLGGWFALPGMTGLMMGLDGRGSAIHITLHSQVIGLALILVAAARAWEEFDRDAMSYVFVLGLGGLMLGLVALELYLRAAARRAHP